MKKKILVLLLIFLASLALAGEKTLISGAMDFGGYGGPMIKVSPIGLNDATGVLVGGQGGWIIDHTFLIGGGGYGLANNVQADWKEMLVDDGEPLPYILDFGYGGLLLGIVNNSDALFHYELFALFGGGGVGYTLQDEMHSGDASDGVFVAEPGVNIMLNMTPFFRIGAGLSYRLVTGVDDPVLSNDDMSGVSGQLIFKFGAF